MPDEEKPKAAETTSEPKEKDEKYDPREEKVGADEQGDLGRDDVEDHEVKHKDDYEKENVKAVLRANIMLISIALVGFIAVLSAILFLIATFETNINEEITEEVKPLITLSGDIYYQQTEGASAQLRAVEGEPTEEVFTAATTGALEPTNNSRNPTWQISRRGKVIAYETAQSNSVTYQVDSEPVTAFEGQAGTLRDWVLTSDGSYIVGLFNDSSPKLVRHSIASGEVSVLDSDFTANGQQGNGRIRYATNGTINWFVFTGDNELTRILANINQEAETEPEVIRSPRLRSGAQISYNSLSSDGSWFVFSFVFEGDDYLGLVSLNSRTVRVMYQATSGSSISSYLWSPDSRTIAVLESQGGQLVRIARLDTGPLTTEVLIDSSTDGLASSGPLAQNVSWSSDGKSITFVNNDSLFSYLVDAPEQEEAPAEGEETSEETPELPARLVTVFENVQAVAEDSFYGWIIHD